MSDAEEYSDPDLDAVNAGESSTQDLYVNPPPPDVGPYLEITEQPQSRGFRFRYACEGKSHGGLQGISSRRDKKSYPSVQIHRYKGPAKIIVSLVTHDRQPKPHAHELIGKNCNNGRCTVLLKGESNMIVSFPNLGIRHVTKKSVLKILTERNVELLKVEKMMTGDLGQDAEQIVLTPDEEEQASRQAEMQVKNMPLSVVRLSFQAYLQDVNGHFSHVLPSIISNPIYDSKAPCASLLKICRMDKVGGCCTGNEEVFLLCDKVQKDDIAVRFYELDDEGNIKWEEFGNFAPHDVHRQYAIVFRTPAYIDTNIERPVTVHVQLKRCSDNEVSDPKTFTYYPQQADLEDIQKKRKKLIPNFTDEETFPSNTVEISYNGNFLSGLSSNNNRNTVLHNVQQYDNNGHSRSSLTRGARADNTSFASDQGTADIPIAQHSRAPIPLFAASSQLEPDSFSSSSHVLFNNVQHRDSTSLSPRGFIHDNSMSHSEDADLVGRGLVARGCESFLVNTMVDAQPATIDEYSKPARRGTNAAGIKVESDVTTKMRTSDMNVQTDPIRSVSTVVQQLSATLVTAVHGYASTGDARRLIYPARKLLANQNDDGDNAVHLSVIHSQSLAASNLLSIALTLPESRAVNDTNNLKQTPLYLSLVTNQMDLLNMLLCSGADCHTIDREGNTLLHIAARFGKEDCLRSLLQRWNEPTVRPIGSENSGAAVRWSPTVDSLNFEGFSAAHLAVLNNQFTCMKLLFDIGGADVNLPDGRTGRTALHHAVATDNLAMVAHLVLECAADINKAQFDGNTALHMAVFRNKLGIAAVLIAADADPDVPNFDNRDDEDDDEEEEEEGEGEGGGMVKVQSQSEKVTYSGTITVVDEDDDDGEYRGFTSRDLAKGNPKMLRILNGEQYSSLRSSDDGTEASTTAPPSNNNILLSGITQQHAEVEGRLKSLFCDSGIESIKIHPSVPSDSKSLGSQEKAGTDKKWQHAYTSQPVGDLYRLDAMVRTRLSKLLDPVRTGSDWRELAERVELGPLANAFQLQRSPTKALLDNYEELSGTCVDLYKHLLNIGRLDCIQLLDDIITIPERTKNRLPANQRTGMDISPANQKAAVQ